ncbi:hypothetical protein OPT61_g7184 [Boeremia exigua]|uniref:Uncharacterized protein n=1 Tax=Boeremia exigua TaxID=749465 RepID=A0ACC2I4C1_9PLEO|nr:hypothetical protein OPT61_g7184 [Boeremia exigua]
MCEVHIGPSGRGGPYVVAEANGFASGWCLGLGTRTRAVRTTYPKAGCTLAINAGRRARMVVRENGPARPVVTMLATTSPQLWQHVSRYAAPSLTGFCKPARSAKIASRVSDYPERML